MISEILERAVSLHPIEWYVYQEYKMTRLFRETVFEGGPRYIDLAKDVFLSIWEKPIRHHVYLLSDIPARKNLRLKIRAAVGTTPENGEDAVEMELGRVLAELVRRGQNGEFEHVEVVRS
jgi:hypothetical protein